MLRAKCQFLLCGAKRAYANNDLIDCVTTLRCHTVASGGPSTSIIIRIYEQVWYCLPPTCFPWHSLVICESMFDRFWRPDDQAFKRINLHQAQLPTICQKKRDTQAFFVGLTTRELETMWYFWASVPFFCYFFSCEIGLAIRGKTSSRAAEVLCFSSTQKFDPHLHV